MSSRITNWSYQDADNWVNAALDEMYYFEEILLPAWSYAGWDNILYDTGSLFVIGGLDPYGRLDNFDIGTVYLEGGKSYKIFVGGEYDDFLEDLDVLIMDDWGYALTAEYFPATPRWEVNIFFTPSYDGWYHPTIMTDSTDYFTAFLYVGEYDGEVISVDPISELHPYIRNKDAYNWDNDIDTGDGWLYIAAEDAQLYRAYMGAMGRIPDAEGFNWWANEIEWGRENLFSMADGFINSAEFKDYADTNFDNFISNHEFVTHMYEGVFGREPDQGGYNYWMGELNAGTTDQGEVLIEMTQSNEYIDQTLEAVAEYLFT